MFKSSNPALSENTLKNITYVSSSEMMTISGTTNKTLLGILLTFIAGAYSVYSIVNNPSTAGALTLTGSIGGFIAAMVTIFKPTIARYSMPIYAILEGVFLGAASIYIPAAFGAPISVVFQAVAATAVTFAVMLLLYRTGVIKVTEKFRSIIIAATIGIAIVYFVLMIMSFFGNVSFMMGTSGLSIGVTAFAAVIAALNLALDFDMVTRLSQSGAPKYMEWYGAFSILVTLVWLYLELLRLFAKLAASNRE